MSNLIPEAAIFTTVAFGSTEAAGPPDADGEPDGVANASDQHAGKGVEPGAGL